MIRARKYVLLCLLFASISFVHSQNFFVQTTTAGNIKGKVQNVNGKNYGVFQGIPFAKPPVGNLRFKEPQPLNSKNASSSVDASNGFSKMCVQTMAYSEKTQSEDCLYLNVLTPKTQVDNTDCTKYPVMVWIYGGGFVLGSTNEYPVDGTLRNIVSRGVVFVSMNYRVGAFGFLTTKSSVAPGNYGLLDQVEALRWVQSNIQFFGGDPSKVTIFGESAGGASVSFLTISPLTKGLFSQAIMMSGSALAPWALMYNGQPNNISANIMESLGCRQKSSIRPTASCPHRDITSTPVTPETLKQHEQELVCLQSKTAAEIASQAFSINIRPRIDGKLLPESPEMLIKKRNPYNLMIGADADEEALFEFLIVPGVPTTIAQTEAEFFHSSMLLMDYCTMYKFPDIVNFTATYHYAHSSTPASSGLDEKHFWFQQAMKMKSAPLFWVPAYHDATEATKTNSKVYLYSWDWQNAMDMFDPKTNFYWKGAPHGSDVFPLFDSDNLGEFVRNGNHTRRDKSQDKKSAEVFGKLFTNFAKFGNPTPDASIDGVIWEPFSVKESNYLSIDMPKIKMAKNFYERDVGLWLNFLPNVEKSVKCAS